MGGTSRTEKGPGWLESSSIDDEEEVEGEDKVEVEDCEDERTETKFGGSRTYIALCAKGCGQIRFACLCDLLPTHTPPPIKSYANLITRLGSSQEYFTHPRLHLGPPCRRRATPEQRQATTPPPAQRVSAAYILGLSSSNTKITLADILPKTDVLFCLRCLLHTLSLHGSTLSAAPQNLVQSPFQTHVPRLPSPA